jgi:hypothetical protein
MLSSCITASKPIPPKHIPSFDFSPPSREAINSQGIRVALIKTAFNKRRMPVKDRLRFRKPPYSDFKNSVSDDLEEILTAKGLTVLGPFNTHDEMVFSDKKDADMLIRIDIELKERRNWRTKTFPTYSGDVYYRVYGGVQISGKLNLTIMDPIDQEKFFKKSIELDPMDVSFGDPLTKWYSTPTLADLLKDDPNVYNPVAKALESCYSGALNNVWRHIDSRELKEIKKQIKSKKNRL